MMTSWQYRTTGLPIPGPKEEYIRNFKDKPSHDDDIEVNDDDSADTGIPSEGKHKRSSVVVSPDKFVLKCINIEGPGCRLQS